MEAQASTDGRSNKVSTATQQYIARMVRNGSFDGFHGAQEYLRSINTVAALYKVKIFQKLFFKQGSSLISLILYKAKIFFAIALFTALSFIFNRA